MTTHIKEKLTRDGYLVIKDFLKKDQLENLRHISANILSNLSSEHREKFKATGSLCNFGEHPEYAPLVINNGVSDMMKNLDFDSYKWLAGYLISKPGNSPPLFWHQDWWGWSNPVSYSEKPLGLGFMYYLSNTQKKNGCLRVIPGSHRRWHALHDLPIAHTEQLSQAKDLDHIAFKSHPDEVAVSVNAGDLLIMDSRLLHSTYPNNTPDERTLLTLWYLPDYAQIPGGIRNRFSKIFDRTDLDIDANMQRPNSPLDWPDKQRESAKHLFPDSDGNNHDEPWERMPIKRHMIQAE